LNNIVKKIKDIDSNTTELKCVIPSSSDKINDNDIVDFLKDISLEYIVPDFQYTTQSYQKQIISVSS
jgi:hypothetical protein